MSPYIGVDDRERFNDILTKWHDFLISKYRDGYRVRYAEKYDAYLVRGVYQDDKTIRFYLCEGDMYFDIKLSEAHAKVQSGCMIYAEAIYTKFKG